MSVGDRRRDSPCANQTTGHDGLRTGVWLNTFVKATTLTSQHHKLHDTSTA